MSVTVYSAASVKIERFFFVKISVNGIPILKKGSGGVIMFPWLTHDISITKESTYVTAQWRIIFINEGDEALTTLREGPRQSWFANSLYIYNQPNSF